MEVRPDHSNKTQFLPSSGRLDTAIWMHYMDANKTYAEKAWRKPHKNAAGNIELVWMQHSTKQQLYGHQPPSRKWSKLDEPDIRDTAGEVGTSS